MEPVGHVDRIKRPPRPTSVFQKLVSVREMGDEISSDKISDVKEDVERMSPTTKMADAKSVHKTNDWTNILWKAINQPASSVCALLL